MGPRGHSPCRPSPRAGSSRTVRGRECGRGRTCLSLQVVEIASLTDHLLTECDKRDGFGRCCRCSEAVPKEELSRHVVSKDCHRECPRGPAPAAGEAQPQVHGHPLAPCLTLHPQGN